MTSTPYYWQHETGDLPAVVTRYLKNKAMGMRDILMMRAYLVQWIDALGWDQANTADDYQLALRLLRQKARRLSSVTAIDDWMRGALELGIDPL